ncbi:related to Vi polysaccharide biosynthesis protein vipA/tviB [Fusarium oxysporum]|uniref:Related to Vi polysaccharide biosynthesis protein vipA/tviB n=1 Tax=Fusarium oxysporum TaxID=5507 RepID=A0A2H3TU16_FUSOX|nr:related to Vi polysaccharide biosynthesis protein vipA/tviB [Fusarium oxysporum]
MEDFTGMLTPSDSPSAFTFYPVTPPLSSVPSETDLTLKVSADVTPDDIPVVAVVGVGYVGTHLVSSFSSRYQVIGFDVSERRIQDLRQEFKGNENVTFSRTRNDLVAATHFLISVPTLLRPNKSIDSSYLCDALKMVGQVARRGSTIVIESSVAVGMTRELVGPIAKRLALFAGMSPERVDPGRTEPPVKSIPKIISGLDDILPGSLDAINRIYSTIFDNVVTVSKPEVAEMMKLYENCQRMVCIAYANEMADACIPHGIDPYEVCSAASTKPFGYMPYAPGVGVGGHCIPVNPYYLLSNSSFPLLEACSSAMSNRPAKLAQRLIDSLSITERRSRVLVVGLGFKPGQSQLDNSPGVDLVRSLAVSGAQIDLTWSDALVKQEAVPQVPRLAERDWNKSFLETFDVIVVAMKQHNMDFSLLAKLEGVRVESWCSD